MLDRFAGRGIAGILAPDLVVSPKNGAQHDPQSVHRSRCQHDLVGIAAQPPRRQEVVGDRGPELATSPRIAIMQMLGAERAHPASRKGSEATQRLTVDVRTAKRQSAVLRL